MVRISDARMSGTSYGTCVLHVAPESFVGGPLAFIQDGDRSSSTLSERRLDLLVDEAELERRRAEAKPPSTAPLSGYGELFVRHVMQANLGCDFDFLQRRDRVAEPVIY